ncbi:MAG TPA: hypothetical protein DHU55_18625 [Blastocatellia bacterium]|jgi:hypothetical protein|nr:hypothetical protein [Blastocatellia bacterium]
MKHLTKTLRYGLAILLTAAGFGFGSSSATAFGQEKTETQAVKSRSNRGARDPFSKYVPPRVAPKKSGLVGPPSIQERIEQYKAQKVSAMTAHVTPPKPTTAFLLSELQVVGISRSPRGYAAIVEASPIKLAYVIYPGERFYDGQLVAIEDNRLVFRRETVFADGRRERSVEMKPLRQPNTVDILAAVKQAPSNSAAASSEKTSEQKPAPDKP